MEELGLCSIEKLGNIVTEITLFLAQIFKNNLHNITQVDTFGLRKLQMNISTLIEKHLGVC